MEINPLYYIALYSAIFTMIITACIATAWNLVNSHFENKKIKLLLALLQDYINGNISDKELTHKTLKLFKPRKGDKQLPRQILLSEKEATQLLIALDQLDDKHKNDQTKKLEYKLWRFVNKEKAS